MNSDFHPYTEKLLHEVCESLQEKIYALSRQADRETCEGSRRRLNAEIVALYEDKHELTLLLT